ncbi:nucleotidyltransferase family protein [Magnetospira sp. QH-2]|uniref:nucleotidyltransferase family protein n=1 Tax=Magnetospira sp. (strain QH-2) TaxID=1288970 RepID=UPI0005F9F2B9|nr:nucleotidyltransferase domain-containing protein [Magnetospira sp. QH-2]
MTREQTISLLRRHAEDFRHRGVAHLALFGSLARGDGGVDSDVDVVIDLMPDADFSLVDMAGIRLMLCDLTGKSADLVIEEDLDFEFKARIAQDRLEVF